METDVVEAIENATPTNNEGNEDPCVAVKLDDTGGGGDRDKRAVIIQFQTYQYRYHRY